MSKILYIFDSIFQTNVKIAMQAEKIFKSLNVDYRIRRIERVYGEISELPFMSNEQINSGYEIVNKADMDWADGYIIAGPVHSGMISAGMKYFLDSCHEEAASGAYLHKSFTAIVTGSLLHGGTEKALDQLYSVANQWGCLVISSSLTMSDGNPYGISFIINKELPYQEAEIALILEKHLNRFCYFSNLLPTEETKDMETKIRPYRIADILLNF